MSEYMTELQAFIDDNYEVLTAEAKEVGADFVDYAKEAFADAIAAQETSNSYKYE